MKKVSVKPFAALLAGVSAIGLSTSAIAQTAEPTAESNTPERGNLQNTTNEASGEIVVTATRKLQSLQDVPMSVDVATGAQIQRLNIFDAKDISQLSPGLELTNSSGRSNAATLRGVQTNPDSGAGAVVDFYYNEVPIDIQTAFTAIYDVDQIEVLRGPQGALRGRTSPGGAITLRTRRANLQEVEGYIQATGSENSAFNFQGGVSVPIVNDKLAIRLSGLYDGNRSTYVRNFYSGEKSRLRTEAGRLSIAFKPTETLDINVTYNYLNSRNRQLQQYVSGGFVAPDLPRAPLVNFVPATNPTIGNRPLLGPSDYTSVDNGTRLFKNKTNFLTVNADWDLDSIAVQGTYGRQRTKLRSSNDQTFAYVVPYSIQQQLFVPYYVDMGEARVLSQNDGPFNWTGGLYYYQMKGDVRVFQPNQDLRTIRDSGFELFAVGFSDTTIPIRSKQYALSGSASYEFTDRLTVEGAARYTISRGRKVQRTVLGGLSVLDPSLPDPLNFATDIPSNSKALTGGANITYEISNDLTTYVAYGRSFRGGTGAVTGQPNKSRDLLITPDETSDSIEVGLKTSFLDRRFSLNVALFYQKYKNYINVVPAVAIDEGTGNATPDGDIDTFGSPIYAGDLTSKGIEATLNGRPTENWDFSIAAAYTRARYDNARLPCNDFNGDGVPDTAQQVETLRPVITGTGNVSYCVFNGRPSATPDFSLTANSEYRFNLGQIQPFFRGLVTYRPSVTTETRYRYPSRTLVNLFAGLRDKDNMWELNGFVKNLLNQKRITNDTESQVIVPTVTFAGAVGDPYNSGYRRVSVTAPREWGVTATYRF